MNAMMHQGYTARIDYDDRDGIFVGRVLGIDDIIGFHAETVDELRQAFTEAVHDYIASCQKLGKTPQRAASGRLMLRIAPDVHRAALVAAQADGKSLNQWAECVLGDAAQIGSAHIRIAGENKEIAHYVKERPNSIRRGARRSEKRLSL